MSDKMKLLWECIRFDLKQRKKPATSVTGALLILDCFFANALEFETCIGNDLLNLA